MTPYRLCVSVLPLSLLFNAGVRPVDGQPLPTRDEHQAAFVRTRPETFYDTRLLPDGVQVSALLHRGKSTRFFFISEAEHSPLSVSVTQCSSSAVISWEFWHNGLSPDDDDEKEDEATDELLQQRHRSTSQRRRRRATLLSRGRSRRKPLIAVYQSDSVPHSGLFSLVIVASADEPTVGVQLLATTDLVSRVPELPTDRRLTVDVRPAAGKVVVRWKTSVSGRQHLLPVEYCFTVATRRPVTTLCEAEDSAGRVPVNAGFELSRRRDNVDNDDGGHSKSLSSPRPDAHVTCVGTRTSFKFQSHVGKVYYVDVFAVNNQTHISAAYRGVAVLDRPTKPVPVVEGSVQNYVAITFRTEPIRFLYRLMSVVRHAVITVRSCARPIRLQLSRGDTTISGVEAADPGDVVKLVLRHPRPGSYVISLWSAEESAASLVLPLQLFVDAGAKTGRRYPFPRMPVDNAVRLMSPNNLTGNSSARFNMQVTGNGNGCREAVLVGWHERGGRRRGYEYEYCLHVRSLLPGLNVDHVVTDHCPAGSSSGLCHVTKDPADMTVSVGGLLPSVRYVAEVYARRLPYGEPVAYKPLYLDTPSTC